MIAVAKILLVWLVAGIGAALFIGAVLRRGGEDRR